MLSQIWACDFLAVTDLFFRSLYAFFIIELHSRPRDPRRRDTISHRRLDCTYLFGKPPPLVWGRAYLMRDNDGKFGVGFARVAKISHIEILRTPYQAPRANAICERFLGSVRRECLDHVLILHEKQLHRVLNAYVQYAQPRSAASRDQAADSRAES